MADETRCPFSLPFAERSAISMRTFAQQLAAREATEATDAPGVTND